VIKAGEKPPKAENGKGPATKAGARTGWVDLSRARVEVVPGAEWLQMFREAWRMMRDHFWTPDLSRVDWAAEYARYRPLVDRVASRGEFGDLMWEIQGELGTSHAYEIGGDYRLPPSYRVGRLGASFVWAPKAKGYRLERLVTGEPGSKGRTAPLAAPGVNVSEGDLLLAIDGVPVQSDRPPQAQLVHRAGQQVALTLADSKGKNERVVVVRTIGNDRGARYRDWVSANRTRVLQATDGRCGYVHVPDMGPGGYADFHRDYLTQSDLGALLVDVRFNGGGHVSQLLLEKLARKRLGYSVPRYGTPKAYPRHSVAGPMVALTNERAGSDGDIFSHCFKGMELGPLIGMRTWGGVIGIWPRHALIDGAITTQPEFSFWFHDVGWGVENHGTDPDQVVDIAPQDHLAGQDPQLEAGIAAILLALDKVDETLPVFDGRPNLARPPLPKR
jgi:tricorn protease